MLFQLPNINTVYRRQFLDPIRNMHDKWTERTNPPETNPSGRQKFRSCAPVHKIGPRLNAIVKVLPRNGFLSKSNRTSSVVTSLGWETTYRGPAFKRRLLKVDFRPQQQLRIPGINGHGLPGRLNLSVSAARSTRLPQDAVDDGQRAVDNFPRVLKKVPKSQAEPASGTRFDRPLVLTLGPQLKDRRSKTYSSAGHTACLTDGCTDRYN